MSQATRMRQPATWRTSRRVVAMAAYDFFPITFFCIWNTSQGAYRRIYQAPSHIPTAMGLFTVWVRLYFVFMEFPS